ncbi:hypothetical protein XELAEV_18024503mg [Xenopus laevis]|uniref:Uncharacterized protein n=1 Tax=Xenopus laevis TaxID=8355 RepID=A0A974HLC3_XENLA|nr:hypothetical protein XELAEV_18024503mg [Xenopus laevis]
MYLAASPLPMELERTHSWAWMKTKSLILRLHRFHFQTVHPVPTVLSALDTVTTLRSLLRTLKNLFPPRSTVIHFIRFLWTDTLGLCHLPVGSFLCNLCLSLDSEFRNLSKAVAVSDSRVNLFIKNPFRDTQVLRGTVKLSRPP